MIYYGIISFMLVIVFNVIWDHRIWYKQLNKPKNTRNHSKGWALKFITCLLPVYFFVEASNLRYIWALLASGALEICWLMLLFDGGYNLLRGEPFFFRGTEDGKDDANTDDFWQSIPQWLHISLKLILAFSAAYIYYQGTLK